MCPPSLNQLAILSLSAHVPTVTQSAAHSFAAEYQTVAHMSRHQHQQTDLLLVHVARYPRVSHARLLSVQVGLTWGCVLEENVLVGYGSNVGREGAPTTTLVNCTIGKQCKIGAGVRISNSYVWDNVVIGDGCTIDRCILANGVELRSEVRIEPGSVLGPGVVIDKGVTVRTIYIPVVVSSCALRTLNVIITTRHLPSLPTQPHPPPPTNITTTIIITITPTLPPPPSPPPPPPSSSPSSPPPTDSNAHYITTSHLCRSR